VSLATGLVAAICVASPARAGTYTVWYCHDGSGSAVPGVERDWTLELDGAGSPPEPVTCDPSEGITRTVNADPNNSPTEVISGADLNGAPKVTLARARIWWHGLVATGSQVAAIALTGGSVSVGGVYEGAVLADHRTNFGPTDALGGAPESYALPANTTGLMLWAACPQGSIDCQTMPFAQFSAPRVALTASDSSPPQGTSAGGLTTDPVLTGQPAATVDATDEGAGLLAARVLVDGQVRASVPFGDRLCRDIDATNGDPLEFATITPCPAHASTTVPLDVDAIGDDAYHHVQVQVVDASGNATTLADRVVGLAGPAFPGFFDPRTRHFRNPLLNLAAPRELNGAGASTGAVLRVYLPVRRSVRIKHGRRKGQRRTIIRGSSRRTVAFTSRPTLRAVLTDAARHPIAGAKVWIASRVEGQEWQITGPPHITGRTGRIGMRIGSRRPSREINVVYFPYSDTHDQAVGRPVKLKVRAGVRLAVDRHRLRNGQRLRFSGAVAGPIASGGATVSLQVKVGHRFQTFRSLRVTAGDRGRFSTRYRFTATTRSARYRFRALVSRQRGLPYARGASRPVWVTVRP
jgi:hypothetical protein